MISGRGPHFFKILQWRLATGLLLSLLFFAPIYASSAATVQAPIREEEALPQPPAPVQMAPPSVEIAPPAAPAPVNEFMDDSEEREPIKLDKDQMDAAHAEVKRDTSIQFDLPDIPKPKVQQKKEPRPQFSWKWLEGLAPILRVLFWVLVGALGLYLLYHLVPAVREWVDARLRRKTKEVDEEEFTDDWTEERTAARHLLKEADALAQQGQYAEAAHLLLWRSIEDIENRRPALIKRDWTSREIAAAQGLPGAARNAFAAIARTVEISLFGKRPVNADAWAQCRDAYARFALGSSWQERAA